MKTLISVSLLLAILSVGSWSAAPKASENTPEIEPQEKITIKYDRVSCPTGCPGYSITIRPDRSVEYEGKENTQVLGKRTYTISAEAYKAILDAIKRAQVERLADEYESVPGRDGGTVILQLSWDGKTKKITHFIPSPNPPEELIELEQAIVKNAYPREKPARQ